MREHGDLAAFAGLGEGPREHIGEGHTCATVTGGVLKPRRGSGVGPLRQFQGGHDFLQISEKGQPRWLLLNHPSQVIAPTMNARAAPTATSTAPMEIEWVRRQSVARVDSDHILTGEVLDRTPDPGVPISCELHHGSLSTRRALLRSDAHSIDRIREAGEEPTRDLLL